MDTFMLVHSPSVGPSTWNPVAEVLRARGHAAVVPSLVDVTAGPAPYWPRVVDAVTAAAPPDGPLVIVAHSNAGRFVPLIAEALRGRISACLFVDAALPPRRGPVPGEPPEPAAFLRDLADDAGILPRWTDWWPDEVVADLFPDEATRRVVVAEQPRLPLDYYLLDIPVPSRWDHVRGAYLWFDSPYAETAKEASERGWPVERIPGGHLHQLTDPESVASWLIRSATRG
ncbi:alpha/beta hydrolase [Microtetraspora sp. AC03309]|uniref:alpha/beta fold hydrolase n=1 Tax=Microtetraspora sp. AC03309 TaxID=2779376 RepID=UPI001E521427|nr:alpha/beta fold hydrolase [Microtetraspora sp. AC03309]MCC5578903.1 alpha/beta hydrolase [Microtetraspora sp. AC03309]